MKGFTLAVLSDLHVDRTVAPHSWTLAKRAFEAAAGCDHLVLAGDVFDCATAMRRDADALKRSLVQRGLWHRDRLSIVVGNHDIFHTAHHGSYLQRAAELARAVGQGAQADYEHFGAWAGQLLAPEDRLDVADAFPFSKRLGHVRLSAADTTERVTADSSNGQFSADSARRIREAATDGRHVLALHNAPLGGRTTVAESLQGYAGGFHARDLRRLGKLCEETAVEAIVCGHLHATDDYQWHLENRFPVYLVGRTGGLHGTTPTFGVLHVPARGRLTWEEVAF